MPGTLRTNGPGQMRPLAWCGSLCVKLHPRASARSCSEVGHQVAFVEAARLMVLARRLVLVLVFVLVTTEVSRRSPAAGAAFALIVLCGGAWDVAALRSPHAPRRTEVAPPTRSTTSAVSTSEFDAALGRAPEGGGGNGSTLTIERSATELLTEQQHDAAPVATTTSPPSTSVECRFCHHTRRIPATQVRFKCKSCGRMQARSKDE
jgi:hypothetical protein